MKGQRVWPRPRNGGNEALIEYRGPSTCRIYWDEKEKEKVWLGKAAGGITFMIMSRVLSTVKLWMKHTAFKKEKKTQRDRSTICLKMMSWHQPRRLRCHLNKWVLAGRTSGDANKSKVGKSKCGAGARCSSRQIISFCLTFSEDAGGWKLAEDWRGCVEELSQKFNRQRGIVFLVNS